MTRAPDYSATGAMRPSRSARPVLPIPTPWRPGSCRIQEESGLGATPRGLARQSEAEGSLTCFSWHRPPFCFGRDEESTAATSSHDRTDPPRLAPPIEQENHRVFSATTDFIGVRKRPRDIRLVTCEDRMLFRDDELLVGLRTTNGETERGLDLEKDAVAHCATVVAQNPCAECDRREA